MEHFRAKVEKARAEQGGSYAAEVLVNLLLKLGRLKEAVAVARRDLMNADERQLTCPGIVELCENAGDFQGLAEVAKRGSAVHFVAAMLAGGAYKVR